MLLFSFVLLGTRYNIHLTEMKEEEYTARQMKYPNYYKLWADFASDRETAKKQISEIQNENQLYIDLLAESSGED